MVANGLHLLLLRSSEKAGGDVSGHLTGLPGEVHLHYSVTELLLYVVLVFYDGVKVGFRLPL